MYNKHITRTENVHNADFPDAIGVIKDLTLQGSIIRFNVEYYADQTAYGMKSSTPNQMPMNDNVAIARKNFTQEITDIEALETTDMKGTITEKLELCCYAWLKKNA